jgi:hypothetical protein
MWKKGRFPGNLRVKVLPSRYHKNILHPARNSVHRFSDGTFHWVSQGILRRDLLMGEEDNARGAERTDADW